MKRIDVLSNEFEKYKSETTIVMNELVDACEIRNDQMRVNHLAQENDSLKKENKALKSDLQKLESLLTETSSKLSVAENEKASLVAVIRLLNEDCANVVSVVGKNERSKSGQPKNPWCTARRRSENQIARDTVSLNNQYSCLTIEDDDESETNVSAEQQSVGHQEVLNIEEVNDQPCAKSKSHSNEPRSSIQSKPQEERRHGRITTQTAKKQRQKDLNSNDNHVLQDKNAQPSDEANKSKNYREKDRKTVVVLGDSIVKYVQGRNLSTKVRSVVISPFLVQGLIICFTT